MCGDSQSGLKLVAMQQGHVSAVAQLHGKALVGDFLPSLGPAFLKTLYTSMLKLNLAFCIVAIDTKGEVVGFVMATQDSRSLFRQIVARRFFQLAWQVGAVILRRPRLITRAFETFLYPSKEGTDVPAAELLVIAVRPGDRSKGIGAALVDSLEMSMRERKIGRYKVTVLSANEAAQRFYRRRGFAVARQFVMYRKPWTLLVRELS